LAGDRRLAVTWLFAMLWPRQRQAGFLAGCCLLYIRVSPGGFWNRIPANGSQRRVDGTLLALTIHALYTTKPIMQVISILDQLPRLDLLIVSGIHGWMEALRFILVYLWVARGIGIILAKAESRFAEMGDQLRHSFWLYYLAICFLQQRAQSHDLGAQLGIFLVDRLRRACIGL